VKKAFDEIYRLYVNDVYKFLMCITGDEKIAEELTQETFSEH
jgi:RNA polymerase sigma-70 factor (ECF subfamily)